MDWKPKLFNLKRYFKLDVKSLESFSFSFEETINMQPSSIYSLLVKIMKFGQEVKDDFILQWGKTFENIRSIKGNT